MNPEQTGLYLARCVYMAMYDVESRETRSCYCTILLSGALRRQQKKRNGCNTCDYDEGNSPEALNLFQHHGSAQFKVPDRGGRPTVERRPTPAMPGWQKRKQDGGGRGGFEVAEAEVIEEAVVGVVGVVEFKKVGIKVEACGIRIKKPQWRGRGGKR